MGKHSSHRRSGAATVRDASGASPDSGRQLADPERREVIEPDRDAEGSLTEREKDLRVRTHGDRGPEDDFHLAAQSPQQTEQDA